MSGPVYVVDLKTMKPVARLEPPKTTGRVSLALSASSRLLFWSADLTRHDSKSGKPSNQKTQIAIFDVAELTR